MEKPGQSRRVMTNDAMLFQHIVEDDAVTQLLQLTQIHSNRLCALRAVTLSDFWRNRLAVGDHPIDYSTARMLPDDAKVIGKRISGSFTRLSHQIGDVDSNRFGFGNRLGNFGNEQVGKNAGV